jgi:adenine-specific DNA-methyltransferase
MPNTKSVEQQLIELKADNAKLCNAVKVLKERKTFGLVWEDKTEQVFEDCQEKLPVLEEITDKAILMPEKNQEMGSDRSVNLIIEGDNYHALSVLSWTHKSEIDVIYIDPPYNSGNGDFTYNDHFVDKEDGFRHSKWLSFMNKRLRLAKDLLTEKGVMFISIGEE